MANREEVKRILEKLDFFSGIDQKTLVKMADSALIRTYGPGEAVVRQGEVGLGLYAILKGRVKVEREHAGSVLPLAELGQDQFFAEISIIDNQPRSATVTTLEDTECVLLTRDTFVRLVKGNPDLALRIARVLAERLRSADEKLVEAKTATVSVASSAPAVAAPVPPMETAATRNGSSDPVSDQASSSMKGRVQDSMLRTFQRLYSMKAMVRFSVAVLGCPVEGAGPDLLGHVRVGDVKALLLPADRAVALDIRATEDGAFTVHVFAPGFEEAVGFGPHSITRSETFQLRLNRGSAMLSQGGSIVAMAAPKQ